MITSSAPTTVNISFLHKNAMSFMGFKDYNSKYIHPAFSTLETFVMFKPLFFTLYFCKRSD